MRNFSVCLFLGITILAAQVHADAGSVQLGFRSGGLGVGGSYEKGSGDTAWGGYLFHQSEKDSLEDSLAATTFGAMLKLYVVKKSNFDVYLAPGFGLTMISDVPVNGRLKDKNIIGASMKIGALWALNPKTKVGLERFQINNWFEEQAPTSIEWTNLVLSFDF